MYQNRVIRIIRSPDGSRLAAWLLREACQTPQGSVGRLLRKGFRKIREAVVTVADPLVGVEVNGTPLLLPLSHELPVNASLYPIYSQNIGRIARIVAKASPDATALVDIGANVGDTAAIVGGYCQIPILCIEGHPTFSDILRRNLATLGNHVSLEPSFVNVTTGTLQGRWDYAMGTARLVGGDTDTPIPTRTLSDILEDHPAFRATRIVKIDTDGFDCAIIEAELEFFAKQHPVLFFEYDPRFYAEDYRGLPGLAEHLYLIGYATGLIYDNSGYYMGRVDWSDKDQLEDLECYVRALTQRSGYVDVCAFHKSDLALADVVRTSELAFFEHHFRQHTIKSIE